MSFLGGRPPLSAAYIIFQMEIIVLDIKINISVKCQPEIIDIDATDIEYKELVNQIKSKVIWLDYETSPKILEWGDIRKTEKYPLISKLLEVFNTQAKGYPHISRTSSNLGASAASAAEPVHYTNAFTPGRASHFLLWAFLQ